MTSTRHQERAYVALKDVQGDRFIREAQIVKFTFVFQNVGNTPAYNVKFAIVMLMDSTLPTEGKIDAKLELVNNVGVVAPTLEVKIESAENEDGNPIALTAQAVAELNSGNAQLCFCGKLRYNDVFGTSHETRFALQYVASAHQFHLAPYYNSMS